MDMKNAERKHFWDNGSLLDKKEALKFFEKMYDTMDNSCEFIKQHGWERDLTKNF